MLEELDEALQIAKSGCKQAVVARPRFVHDMPCLDKEPYRETRDHGLVWQRSYEVLHKGSGCVSKWGRIFWFLLRPATIPRNPITPLASQYGTSQIRRVLRV